MMGEGYYKRYYKFSFAFYVIGDYARDILCAPFVRREGNNAVLSPLSR